jgi:signal transduction histidine kinase
MRMPIQLRLTLTTLAVLLLGMGLAAALAWLAVEGLFLANQRENLLAQARLTAAALEGAPLPPTTADPYMQTMNVMPGIHTRLLGEQGAVVVNLPITADDAPIQMPLAENAGYVAPEDLILRPEIQAALNGTAETAVRRVAAADNRRVLYAAAPVLLDTGEIVGIAYLATPLPPTNLPPAILLQLIGAVLAAVLLAGAAGALLSRRIARPLEQLAGAASAVAVGDLAQQVPANSRIGELDSVGEAFNHMTASLHQANQTQNAFIADVTHELRTPLTVINGTIETLEDGAVDDLEGRGPLLASMKRETDRLIRLVNDLLVLTRAEAGALNLKREPLDLAELARGRCNRLAALAAPRGIRLDIDAQGSAQVCGDVDRLSQALDNLLDNAIRHAPENTAVTTTIWPEEGGLRCTIRDYGPGIPAEHLPQIFERFYRVEASRARHSGGAGLGLAIVKSLVEAHDGHVTAESSPGQGASISFWLPAAENCHPTD